MLIAYLILIPLPLINCLPSIYSPFLTNQSLILLRVAMFPYKKIFLSVVQPIKCQLKFPEKNLLSDPRVITSHFLSPFLFLPGIHCE